MKRAIIQLVIQCTVRFVLWAIIFSALFALIKAVG